MNTAAWVKIHGYISMFFLPLALFYAITGSFVIFGNWGELSKEKHPINLDHQLLQDVNAQKAVVVEFLQKTGEKNLPVGEPKLIRNEFFWGQPSSINLNIEKGEKDGEATLHLRRPDLLFSMIILHKAKGGRLFDYLGFSFALAMIIMYLSGVFIFWKIKSKRTALSLTFLAGTVVTLAVIYLSL